jgi:peptidylprolyl isomerase
MITTDSGLCFEDITEGTGKSPETGQIISVHYTGTLENGQKFDSSLDRNAPIQYTHGVGMVIKGWEEGLATMKPGGKRRLYVPAHLGYGTQGAGKLIPAHANLIFDVELLEVVETD